MNALTLIQAAFDENDLQPDDLETMRHVDRHVKLIAPLLPGVQVQRRGFVERRVYWPYCPLELRVVKEDDEDYGLEVMILLTHPQNAKHHFDSIVSTNSDLVHLPDFVRSVRAVLSWYAGVRDGSNPESSIEKLEQYLNRNRPVEHREPHLAKKLHAVYADIKNIQKPEPEHTYTYRLGD